MKTFLKWLFFVVVGLLLITVLIGYFYHQPLPKGQEGAAADQLARKMEVAVNKAAWDTTKWVRWTYAGGNTFVWDKDRSLVKVNTGNQEVLIDISTQEGKAWEAGQRLKGEDEKSAVKTAWFYFCNDSFWLCAPMKAFDPGVERKIVQIPKDGEALLVTYDAGGVTPGDSYLWILDENGRPNAWKMWVSIIPIGGLETSWENWTTLSGGSSIALSHKIAGLKLEVTNLKAGMHFEDLDFEKDPFQPLF